VKDGGRKLAEVEARIEADVLRAESEALLSREKSVPSPESALHDVYAS
jgi:hypothetical protein